MAEPGVSFSASANLPIAILSMLAMRVANPDPALDEIGAMLVTETQHRFEEEKDPDGHKWDRLAAATIAVRGSGAKILRHRANLYDSVTHAVDSRVDVRVGTNKKYARIHQFGGPAGLGHSVEIPARPYLGISDEGAKEVEAILRDHIASAVDK